MHRIAAIIAVAVVTSLASPAIAETLTFSAQYDGSLDATNHSWFSADNWFVFDAENNPLPAGRVPLANETVVITGTVDVGITGVRVRTLVLTNGATVLNGTLSIEELRLYSSAGFQDATVNVLTTVQVAGTNCALRGGTLSILGFASGSLSAVAPVTGATLNLHSNAVLLVIGSLALEDGSQITATGEVPSRLVINGRLSSTNQCTIGAAADSHLVVDNSGVIRAHNGTLAFEGNIDWQSLAGLAQFEAAETNAFLLFAGPMQTKAGVASVFTGPGTNVFQAGGEILGAVSVGTAGVETNSMIPGNLVIAHTLSGTGDLWILGQEDEGAALYWQAGTLSIPEINVDPGARMFIPAGNATNRVLSGCAVNNGGVCTMGGGEFSIGPEASVNILAGAVFEAEDSGAITGAPSPVGGAFNNTGTFRKSGTGSFHFGANSTAQGPDFNNAGVVDVREGELHLSGGSNSWEFRTATNALLSFWGGTYTLKAGTDFNGPGWVRVAQGVAPVGWLITSSMEANRVHLGANATVTAQGRASSVRAVIGSLAATANATLADGNFLLASAELSGDVVITNAYVVLTSSLSIAGTNCALRGSALRLERTATGSLGAGDQLVPAALSLLAGSLLENAGHLDLPQYAIITSDGLPSSTIRILQGGELSGSGVLQVRVENFGTVRPNGVLTVSAGNEFQQDFTGRLLVGVGRSAGTQNDRLDILGQGRLDGELAVELVNGFEPELGQEFDALTAASLTGQFARITGDSPPSTVWVADQAGTKVTLSLRKLAALGPPSLADGHFSFAFPTTSGLVYLLQAATDLRYPWETIEVLDGNGTVQVVSEAFGQYPRRFYRVLIE